MKNESQKKEQLYAPQVDTLLFHAERLYEIADEETKKKTMELFHILQTIAVCGEDECRELWLTAPRGTIEEFGSYEEYLEEGEVENRKEFEELWISEYPEQQKWYRLTTMIYRDIYSVFVDGKLVLQDKPEPQMQYPFDKSELTGWLLDAVGEAITLLDAGKYNKHVSNELPCRKRIGKIWREDYWRIFPEEKEAYWSDIEPYEIQRFTKLIKEQTSDSPVFRLPKMTAGLFFDCCRLGYEANRYERIEQKSSKEMYQVHADGRDEGLTLLDESSFSAFEVWYHDRTRHGGHPWEVCRGGNSTHVSLYVHQDEKGWWFGLAGSSMGRSVETVKFFLALVDNGMPVYLDSGNEIAAMLTGEDYIGIVPEGVFPRYCGSLFPGENMLTFMNLPWEETNRVIQAAFWYPIREVQRT